MRILRTKSVEQSIKDTQEPEHRLRKVLGPLDLVVFGIGVTIGTGIFVLTGVAAATKAGPAIALSFVIAGLACALAGLCYAEFASAVPVAGSAYTFSYASLGEFIAWIIGWDLVLEFLVGAATVSIGWSRYFGVILDDLGIHLPATVTGNQSVATIFGYHFESNLLAAFIALALTVVLITGVRMSSRFNLLVTAIKLAVVAFFILFGIFHIHVSNWSPFIPPSQGIALGTTSMWDMPLLQLLLGKQQVAFGWPGNRYGCCDDFLCLYWLRCGGYDCRRDKESAT